RELRAFRVSKKTDSTRSCGKTHTNVTGSERAVRDRLLRKSMNEATRRGFLLGMASGAATLYAGPARATLVRGLPLALLVQRSERILVVEALEAASGYAEIGGRRSIIT